ncbi:hypothetical protein Despr_0644 [Desulfobulbus propionicus DSM 2032]|jgi:hypothetical protein|uniref:Lipoprotein SmpA/OmlA domain-containing protein n=1 Tax=Desulfobulbus propionicus (strain ATCC 33891 / DSM 2032 / VKM B-1956 / 1pr3) TaxID=577650 RepID=A0A7U3YK18_DESPD|nr:hypothetical protein [Desulfobulbus propionicus]ADW16820.1 hypothetical protein Despr_0644 [Desulfobulbus propionicus DSM 2032]
MRQSLFICLLAFLVLAGCSTKQVRHLASDASLIKPGQSTVKDVQKYLGEPDSRREVSPGVSEFVYYEDRPGLFGNTPILGSMTGPSGYEMIVFTIEHDMVTSSEFRNFNESDRKWAEDYTWEEVK